MAASTAPSGEYEFKVIIVGSSAVGKSCLALRFVQGKFSEVPITVGAAFLSKTVTVGSANAKLALWDTAGQEKYRALVRTFYRGTHAAVVVYDITNAGTFTDVKTWIADLQEKAPAGIVLVIVGNKKDLEAKRAVPTATAAEFAASQKALFLETSALTAEGIPQLFDQLSARLIEVNKDNPQVRAQAKQETKPQKKKGGGFCEI